MTTQVKNQKAEILEQLGSIRLGQINFINCLPINMALEKFIKENELLNISTVNAVPSELNQKLREGELDLAPVSSFEYLCNKENYDLIDSISISSKTSADSVLLFIKDEEFWQNNFPKTIHLTDKSATSVNLLKILLVKYFKVDLENIRFETFSENSTNYDAKLLIGDEALTEKQNQYSDIIDLGEKWFELTGLPMVFGLWTARKNRFNENELEELKNFFKELKERGFNELYPDMIIEAYKETGLAKFALKKYFKNLDYNFNDKHRESLEQFETYLSTTHKVS